MPDRISGKRIARQTAVRIACWLVRPCVLLVWLLLGDGPAVAGTHIWNTEPAGYPIIDPQAVADGAITYDIDLGGFNLFGHRGLNPARLARFNDAVRQAFTVWNTVIAPLDLQFREARFAEISELAVRATPYDDYDDYFGQTGNSVALSLAWPFGRVYSILPIWFDSTESFDVTHDAPLIADHLLSQPYITIVDSEQFDIYAVALHEIGHVLGLGHVAAAIRGGYNVNFLANTTVQVDPASIAPSQWLGGMQVDRRRPVLELELYSLMIPLRLAYPHEIPPDDRAAVAFTLRNLNPAGADQILAEARRLYERTSPLRFANVVYELEKNDANDRNNTPETAMPILPDQVIIGSLFGPDINDAPPDRDCYRLDLGDLAAGTELVLDIDEAGGLFDTGATKTTLSLLDKDGSTIATGDPVGDPPDPDSYSPDDPVLRYTVQNPGVYYILIAQDEEEGTAGMYVLKVGLGGPVEPTGERTPTIDPTGAGTPTPMKESPLDGLCPGVGFSALALGFAGLWLVRRSA